MASPSRSTIQYRGSLRSRLAIPAAALDLLKVAAAVYCADRLTERPGTWTRSIELSVPVREPELWGAVRDQLVEAISFLSGDRWQLEVRPSAEPVGSAERVRRTCRRRLPIQRRPGLVHRRTRSAGRGQDRLPRRAPRSWSSKPGPTRPLAANWRVATRAGHPASVLSATGRPGSGPAASAAALREPRSGHGRCCSSPRA